MPARLPVTIPEDEPTVTMPVRLPPQMPPVAASVKLIVCPEQTLVGPDITESALTVIVLVDLQPVLNEYVIIAEPAPDANPVTTPVVKPTVAIVGLPEDHVPPIPESASVIVCPAQTPDIPVIAGADVTIFTVVVTTHPVPIVRLITVLPGSIPVTRPVDEPIVAILVLLLAQVPVPPVLVRFVVVP